MIFIRNFMSVLQTSDWQKDPLHPVFDSRTRHQTGQSQNLPHHHRPRKIKNSFRVLKTRLEARPVSLLKRVDARTLPDLSSPIHVAERGDSSIRHQSAGRSTDRLHQELQRRSFGNRRLRQNASHD